DRNRDDGSILHADRLPALEEALQVFSIDRHLAERAVRLESIGIAQEKRRTPGVDQRDHAEEDFVRQLVDIESAGDRQTDVVERLELPQPVLELKIALARFLRQALIRDHGRNKCRAGTQDLEVIL